MLQLNDTVCRRNSSDDSLEFGRVVLSIENFWAPIPQIDLQKQVPVIWSSGEVQIVENVEESQNATIGIVSRNFKQGSLVLSLDSGKEGYVVEVEDFATLQLVQDPTIIFQDVPCHRLSTIMDFYSYPGAHILYHNWIGMIIWTKKLISYSHNNDIFFSIVDNDENFVQVPPWMDPYWISDGSMLYPGQQFILTKKMWQEGHFDSVWGKTKSLPLIGKVFVVENIEVLQVNVQWICPAHKSLLNYRWDKNIIPCNEITGEDILKIKNVSTPSHLLATSGSGRIFQSTDQDIAQSIDEWTSQFSQEVLPHQMYPIVDSVEVAGAGPSGDSESSSHQNKKIKLDSEENTESSNDELKANENVETTESSNDELKENKTNENCHVVKVLFTRQIATIIFEDGELEEINSNDLLLLTVTKEENFHFKFGDWVKRKRSEFYDEKDKIYGIVLKIMSASTTLIQWTQVDSELTLQEECHNFELELHNEYNSLQRGIIVLLDFCNCGVVVDNISTNLKIRVKGCSGQELYLDPHKLCPIPSAGFWDVLKQKWSLESPQHYIVEKQMNPYSQTEIFFQRVQVFDNVPQSHFYAQHVYSCSDIPGIFVKTIYREILFLKQNLPEGIWIQFYMDRIDLVSAAIRGAKNTPYESMLFFFDIKIPNTYPESPPQVRFISFGHKDLNPNFNVDGTICSSLLETVTDGVFLERWISNTSNIMQILLSIQGLYLVEHPLFNTARYQNHDVSKFYKLPHEVGLSKMYNTKLAQKLLTYYSSLLKNPTNHWRFLIIANLFSTLENLVSNMKKIGVIQGTNQLSDLELATIHMELILQNVNENLWQFIPRLWPQKL